MSLFGSMEGKRRKDALREAANELRYGKCKEKKEYENDDFFISKFYSEEKEREPVLYQGDSYCVFVSGKIFDFNTGKLEGEFRNDAELCLELYESKGRDFVKDLNGRFVIIIYNSSENKLLIFSDRYGLERLYYVKLGDEFLFSSEMKPFLILEDDLKKLDWKGVGEYFSYGFVLGNKTLLENVKVFPPASIGEFKDGKLSMEQYWDFDFRGKHGHSEEYYITRLAKTLGKSVKRRISKNKKTGISISGGLDSRVILALASKLQSNLLSFTYGFSGSEDKKIAEEVGERLRIEQKPFDLNKDFLVDFAEEGTRLTEGMLPSVHIHMVPFLEKLQEGTDEIILSGGLGELLGDYLRIDKKIFDINSDKKLVKYLSQNLDRVVEDEKLNKFFNKKVFEKIKDTNKEVIQGEINRAKADHPLNKAYYFLWKNDLWKKIFYGMDYLRKKLNVKLPNFDNEFIDAVLEIPPKLRFRRRIEYKLLRKVSPETSDIPYNTTGLPIKYPFWMHWLGFRFKCFKRKFWDFIRKITGGRIYKEDKRETPDYGEWLRKNDGLRNYFKEILIDGRLFKRGIFNEKYIREIFEKHIDSKEDHTSELYTLLTFELWLRRYLDTENEIFSV